MILLLRQERARRNWTQKFVADKIGITQAMLQKIETGKRKPSYNVLVKLLDLFDFDDPRILFKEIAPSAEEST